MISKKKILMILMLLVLIIVIILLLSSKGILGKKPFKNLESSDILSISVFAIPPNKTVLINDNEHIKEITAILNTVVIYQRDDSGRDNFGQLVQYTLKMKDGSSLEVGAYNPFVFVNGKSYKTKYQPCENLNSLGNKLINEK